MNEYHERITELFDEYYRDKTAVKRRIEQVDALIEEFIDKHGKRPPASVCSRLATYILLDTLTDKNEHKVKHEEYPVLSRYQIKLRQERESVTEDVYTGVNDEYIGRYRGTDGINHRIYDYMTPDREQSLVPAKYLDLYSAIDNAGLTNRQRQAIELVYFEGMTQEAAGEVMGVSHKRIVGKYCEAGIEKIRDFMRNNSE